MSNLAEVIQDIARQTYQSQSPTDLLYGTVTSVSPLRVRIDNRFEIGAQHLILSALCKPLKKETRDGDEVVLWRGLAQGDRVRALECGGGQLFYILDREGDYNL